MKSLTHIHFGTQVPREGVPIAYVATPKLTAQTAVALVDTSSMIPQNSFLERTKNVIFDESDLNFFVENRRFLVTNRFSSSQTPLYYKHTLTGGVFEGNKMVVSILDDQGQAVDSEFWEFDSKKNVIYHNLSLINGNFFVVYPRADSEGNLVEPTCRELLMVAPAFREATEEHVLTGRLLPDADAYLIEKKDGQPYYWRVTLPRPGVYQFHYVEDGLLRIKIPVLQLHEPWYPEVVNNWVLTTQIHTGELLQFAISEFLFQNFYPFPPLRMVTHQKAIPSDNGVLLLGKSNLVLTTKTPLDLKIFDATGYLLRALTTDISKAGQYLQNVPWEVNVFRSIDPHTGRVVIDTPVMPGQMALATFYYEDSAYRYTGINLNPLYNPGILEQQVVILCKPFLDPAERSLSHVTMTRGGVLLEASDPDISAWLTGKTFSDLVQQWLYQPGTSVENSNNYFLLGMLTVALPWSVKAAQISDVRRRGGGINPDIKTEAVQTIPGSSQNWDIKCWDGPPDPLAAGIIVYLPSLLKTIYSDAEIRRRAEVCLPLGTRLLIRYFETSSETFIDQPIPPAPAPTPPSIGELTQVGGDGEAGYIIVSPRPRL